MRSVKREVTEKWIAFVFFNKTWHGRKKNKSGKQWTTAISAAAKTLQQTGSIEKARQSLRKQALANARKLFGSVGEKL
jgi:hypothetical protein